MNITRGKINAPKKVVIYGPEGIGKSTMAAQFPNPLFIDTEGSTKELDVARMDKPSSWEFLLQQIEFVKINRPCGTLIIDTVDWAEQLCLKALCDKNGKNGIEDFGYGKGWVYEKEWFGKFLNALEEVINAGINVVLTAHAMLRKFEQPDELGSYDRWEMKLGAKTTNLIAPMVKEWADMVLFCNYKTLSVAVDKDGKKHKAQGGRRVMYTSHHPCWDGKNRYGLAEEIPMEYAQIQHILEGNSGEVHENSPQIQTSSQAANQPFIPTAASDSPASAAPESKAAPAQTSNVPDGIPKELADLMTVNKITEAQIRRVVAERGYYPEDMPISAYPKDFVYGVLVGAWEQVKKMIEESYPF